MFVHVAHLAGETLSKPLAQGIGIQRRRRCNAGEVEAQLTCLSLYARFQRHNDNVAAGRHRISLKHTEKTKVVSAGAEALFPWDSVKFRGSEQIWQLYQVQTPFGHARPIA